jgi:hypothetical protein
MKLSTKTNLVLFVFGALLPLCGSLLAGAPASPSSSRGCHGGPFVSSAPDCHGDADELHAAADCHGAEVADAGCHGRSRSTIADRRSHRVAGRAAARADRASSRADRAEARARAASSCHGAGEARKAAGCHGSPGESAPKAECECSGDCDCG